MGCVWIVRLCYCGFGLAGATLSPTRISLRPDQTGNHHSVAHEKGILLNRIKVCKNGDSVQVYVCVCVVFFFKLTQQKNHFPFFLSPSCLFLLSSLCSVFIKSMICCVSPCRVAPHSSHSHPFSARVLKWIAFQCVAAPGLQPAVFDISSTC